MRLLVLILCLLFASVTNAAAVFVNSGAAYATSGSTTIASSSFSATAGNTIIVLITAYNDPDVPVVGVTDTAGNTYELLATGGGDANHTFEFWVAYDINANASNVVTASFSPVNAGFRGIAAAQYSGVPEDSFIAASSAVISSNGTTHATGTVSTGAVDDALLIGGWIEWGANNEAISGGANTTLRVTDQNPDPNIILAERIVASAGTYSTVIAGDDDNQYVGKTIAFDVSEEGGGGGGGNAPRALHLYNQMRRN